MLDWPFQLPYLLGVVFVVFVLALQKLLKRVTANQRPLQGTSILSSYLSLMTSFCGITLAFLLNAAWSNHEQTRGIVDREAQVLGSIAFIARGLPDPVDDNIVSSARSYAQTTIDDEWPSLARRRHSLKLDQESARLGLSILRYQPTDANRENVRQQLMGAFADLRVLRAERRLKAQYSIPGVIWAFILFSTLSILVSCVLLEIEHQKFHIAQTGLIAAFLALSLVIMWDLQNPFDGFSKVGTTPFSRLQDDMFTNETAWQKLNSESRDISPR